MPCYSGLWCDNLGGNDSLINGKPGHFKFLLSDFMKYSATFPVLKIQYELKISLQIH